MRKTRFTHLLAFALLAGPAIAQPPLGTRIDPAPGAVTPQDSRDQMTARRVMRTFSACMIRTRPRVAREVLAAPYASEEQSALVRRRLMGEHACMGASGLSMAFGAPAFAGALAEAGLQSRFATADLAPVAALTPEAIARANISPRNGYEDLALCVVRRDPAVVRDLALAEPASAEERAARRRVHANVGPCVNQGQSLSVDMVGLRAMLAVSLYRALDALAPGSRRN